VRVLGGHQTPLMGDDRRGAVSPLEQGEGLDAALQLPSGLSRL